jgi:hypothetical protein
VINRKALLADLKKQVQMLENDLRDQVEDEVPDVRARLRAEYDRAFKLGRTAATWTTWRDERVTQAAAAWVLGTVFVRFCEDNGLLTAPYLAGPSADRMVLAEEAQEEFFRDHPAETDRGWLLAAFTEIAASQAGLLLFDQRHNALYQIPVSHDAAKALIAFWRRRGEDGKLVHDFEDESWDTRFLGDLYQDLSETARKKYALLQTPEFVEEFILDYTLKPAITEFGHDVVRMIDPTCGSGHFVLGAFHRLLAEWEHHAPGRDARDRVKLALEAVHGVDINPFAVAIARFRLFVAALRATGFTTPEQLKDYELPLNIAIGDSLIKARQLHLEGMSEEELKLTGLPEQTGLFTTPNEQASLFFQDPETDDAHPKDPLAEFAYVTEDIHEFPRILKPSSYHVVVGNPPYITVKDKRLNQLYRHLYNSCSGKYALSVPFAERLFQLAIRSGPDRSGSGFVGQITANSFMKREFGRKLIEEYFPTVELTHVVDTSGAYIPGHGTPTVIIIGRRTRPRNKTIRTVLGIRGEPNQPSVPAQGQVWRAIEAQIDKPGSEDSWVSVSDLPRRELARYPWSLAGGGASTLLTRLESCADRVLANDIGGKIGPASFAGMDDPFFLPGHWHRRFSTPSDYARQLVTGENVRDWWIYSDEIALTPYGEDLTLAPVDLSATWGRHLWSMRRALQSLIGFGGETRLESGTPWWEWYRWIPVRYQAELRIVFASVSTHPHFSLDRGGKAFNRHAPVIILHDGASEDDYLALLGVLNSSVACFWIKQVSHDKGSQSGSGGFMHDEWERFYDLTGAKLQAFPLPATLPRRRARKLDDLALQLNAVSPAAIIAGNAPTRERLVQARREWTSTRSKMIAVQEELDWEIYSLYGLLEDDLIAPTESIPDLKLGERAFEIVLARKLARGEDTSVWFTRHDSTPTTELPPSWPTEYRKLVEKRIALIESDRNIGLIERPEYKRRWSLFRGNNAWGWMEQEAAALRDGLLDRFEARELWFRHVDGVEQPRMRTTAELADALRADADVVSVAELYAAGKDLEDVVAELVADEHVPHLAALRYRDSGLSKRSDWEHVWDLQRQEDAALSEADKKRIGDSIPLPPKYGSPDFRKSSYWCQRGKLDVPKERFISYPHASRDGDSSLLLGWAGWDYREQAQALATLIVDREQNDGWGADKLTPLLAGLREVLPWVKQWHSDFDPVYAASPAEIYASFLDQTCARLHLKEEDLTAWRPPSSGRTRKTSNT